jgi:putative nucleotidyltransferase with HDIG domain
MGDDEPRKRRRSLKEIFLTNNLGWRLLIALFFTLCLAAFLHFRETRVEVLELGATASKYVVAQVDFEYVDPEAMILLKQDAIRGIGKIFRIEEASIRQMRYEIENQWILDQQAEKLQSLDELYVAVDLLDSELNKTRFTDSRTLQKLNENNYSTDNYLIFQPTKSDGPSIIPREYWRLIRRRLPQSDAVSSQALTSVINFYQMKKWSFTVDSQIQASLINKVQKNIAEKKTFVRSGTRIIDQGEKVTPRHILMISAMKKALGDTRRLSEPLPIIGSLLMAIIFTLLSAWYFYYNNPEIVRSLQKLSLLITIILLTLILSKITELVLLLNPSTWFELIRYPLLVPFATILVCTLLNSRIALFTAAFLAVILGISLAIDHSKFLVINLITALVVIIAARSMRKRKEIFRVCFYAYLSAIPILFAFSFNENQFWSISLGIDFLSSLLFLLLTGILVVGLLPLLESLFRIMTDMSLMEYMDPNNELLRKLMIEVPGTYQHCLVLGNIAEAAARAIGANGLFCRVACLYHDIGKMNNPHFFTENQQGGVNIHQLLTPVESAQVIISHVTDGEMLARKYRLPQSFIDVILEHHGTTLVYYFFAKEVELKGGNIDEVDEMAFRYPGPKPHSKESAIIMISDSCEAASRSLDEVTEKALRKLVNRVVTDKAEEEQFDECRLTFEELGIVKEAIVKTLMLTHHVRIKYPKKRPD